MAEIKTKPTDANVYEFLENAATARRRDEGLQLVEIFNEVTGSEPVMWGPSMVGYGSYLYISQANPRTRGNWLKTGFSPRKAQLTFYGLIDLPAHSTVLPQLGTYTLGAGCVYAKKIEDLDLEALRKLIAIAWARGDDPEPA